MIETENTKYGIDMDWEVYGLKLDDESCKKYAVNMRSKLIQGGILRFISTPSFPEYIMKGYQYDKSY